MAIRHRILMCPPDHFTVSYSINPWMDGEEGEVSRSRAQAEWRTLHAVLEEIADIELLAPVAGLPDMVFTANAGVVYGRRALVSRFAPAERRSEEAHFRRWFESHGFDVAPWPEELVFEGAGDTLLDRTESWVWAGFGQRTERSAHEALADFYPDRELISLHLSDPFYYHIDTCLQPLEGGHLIYFPQAFDADGLREIERRIPAGRRIPVAAEEAEAFACNAVNLGEHVVLNRPSTRLQGELERAGFAVTAVDLSEFIRAGGAAKCLVLRIDEP